MIKRNALEFTALFLWGNRTVVLYTTQNNPWMLGNMKLFLVLNKISHSSTRRKWNPFCARREKRGGKKRGKK